MYDVIALGELLIDFAPVSTDDRGYPTLAAHPGGAPGNFLAALSRCGAKTAFWGKVGDDRFGSLLRSTLAEAGVDVSGVVVDPHVFTTLAFVTLDDQGDRSFSFARKPGADTQLRPDELDLSQLDRAKVFHFGTLSLTCQPVRSATQTAVAYAKDHGLLITFDPNLRKPLWDDLNEAREQILWGLRQADVVKLSDEEVDFLWSCSPQDGAARLLRDFGTKLAMVTMGANGCLLQNKNGSALVGALPVHAVDTTGAGDIFGGAALSRILALGLSPDELTTSQLREVGRFAAAAAGLSVRRHGGISSIPFLQEVEEAAATLR